MSRATGHVSAWRQLAAFVLVSVSGSLLASAVLITWGFLTEPAKLEDQHTLSDFAELYFGIAALGGLFAVPSLVIIGIPAVLIARRLGLVASRTRFLLFCTATGVVVWGFSTTVLLAAEAASMEYMPWWLVFGATTGALGGYLWWQLVERYRTSV